MLNRSLVIAGALALAGTPFVPFAVAQHPDSAPEPMQSYTQTNLVSNLSGGAAVTDPNLANAWGLSRSSNGDWWVSDNTTGLSTLYSGTTGAITPLVVTIPPSNPNLNSTGSPTGTVFNGTTGFAVAPGAPAVFLFATEDGTISGWNPKVNPSKAIIAVNDGEKSVFKGLTIAPASFDGKPLAYYLYAADFRQGRVAVYDSSFQHNAEAEANFARVDVPKGFAPFNVQNIGGDIYVAFAKQDAPKHDEIDGTGLGYVAVFDPTGHLIQMLEPGKWFDAPWGLAVAPSDFGVYSHDVLVGNFGSGEILAFDPVTGSYRGKIRDAKNNPIHIQGLWGISFGNGTVPGGPATTLFFSAGPNNEANGLFGTLTAVQNSLGNGQ
jgi:uncharacterized protein (TIGR03118 family)